MVIIVNWNAAEDTLEVLGQLDEVEGREQLDYLVVDNQSNDDSVARLREARPNLQVIETGANRGFAGGTVVGVRAGLENPEVGWVLFLNNDIRLDPSFLPPLLAAAVDPEVAAVGPKIFYADPPDRLWAAGGKLRLRETVTRELGRNRTDGAFDRSSDVTYLTTCCILIPRDAFEAVGLLNPMYFICVEDADWCRRAVDAGYRLRYVAGSRIWHRVAVSTGGGYTPLRTFHTARSNALFVRKHHGLWGLTVFLLANCAALPVAFLRELPKGNARAVFGKARGLWRGLMDPLSEPPRL